MLQNLVILNEDKVAFPKWLSAPFTTHFEVLAASHSIEETQQEQLMENNKNRRACRRVHHLLDDTQREGLLMLFARIVVLVPF